MLTISLLSICILSLNFGASNDTQSLLERYREEVLTRPIFLESGPLSDTTQQLQDLGPNILSAIADSILREPDPRVRKDMTGLFLRIAAFREYVYVGPTGLGHQGQHPRETNIALLPLLSRDITRKQDESNLENRVLTWWNQRDGFLRRADACGRLREITGRSVDEALNYDRERANEINKEFAVFGIYNLPYYITVIAEDNNPVLFAEFLARWRLFQEYRHRILNKASGFASVKAVQDEYPTVDAKMAVVCTWWKEKKHTFTELADLYEAIDEVVGKYCPKD